MSNKLIVANWKTYLSSEAKALALAEAYAQMEIPNGVEAVMCPPFLYIEPISRLLATRYTLNPRPLFLGAQTAGDLDDGPETGEVSPAELKDLGVQYVLLGHSERRASGETNEMVRRKIMRVLADGLEVILCVGESSEVHVRGFEVAREFVLEQLTESLSDIKFQALASLTVAYEPLWAISKAGVGESDTPEAAARMIAAIRLLLNSRFKIPNSRILYGGSVRADNSHAFLSRPEIDGALVGHASIDAGEFQKIISAAAQSANGK